MDWDLCKTFVAVAETRSFAAAARQLRSSHPTVGRKIAELENQLGIPLFARSHEGLSLTAQGRKFREHVEAMAAAALRAEAAVSATGAQARGVVKLSIGSTLASHWLMPKLGPFLRAHDHIQLEIITYPYPASVRRREADVVLPSRMSRSAWPRARVRWPSASGSRRRSATSTPSPAGRSSPRSWWARGSARR
jgi:DNA-binding transcriptional LysR family regulator